MSSLSDISIQSYLADFPRQKLPRSQKTEEWGKKCVDAGIKLKGLYGNTRRSPRARKIRNYNLYNGKFDKEDLGFELQPILGDAYSFPANLQYRDIISPIFQTLFGEEAKRGSNFIVRAINEDAISQKETEMQKQVLEYFQSYIVAKAQDTDPEQTPQAVIDKLTYSFQDTREEIATHLLNYYKRYLKFDQVFQKGWEDAILAGEEIYCAEEIANEPILRRVNTIELHFLLPHNSDVIDDAEVIYEETYMSVGKVIDDFYEILKAGQIDELEGHLSDREFLQSSDSPLIERLPIPMEENISSVYSSEGYFDTYGNIRVAKVTWKSRRKIGIVKFVDENGDEQQTIVDEVFKVPRHPDISVEWLWVNEYWEGIRIGKDTYVNIRPKTYQFRKMDNLSQCKSGYFGTVYNCNNSQSVSLMDRIVPWAYLYTTIWYRTELLLAKNLGKLAKINVDMVPDGWEMSKWLYYAQAMNIAFISPFNEGKKGAATGKLAGQMTGESAQIDLELGNSIQHHISTLQFIESKIQQLSGVTPQRMGDISPTELVGNVQTAIATSATVTEPWFQIHNWTKQRAIEGFLEVAKGVLQNKSKKLQYITDDMATVFFEIDGNLFSDAEYGVFVTNSTKDTQALEMLKQLTQAALQNDKIQMSDVAELLTNESMASIKNKLKQSEQAAMDRQQQSEQQTMALQKQMQDEKIAFEQAKMTNDNEQKQLDRDSKERIATISTFFGQPSTDMDNDGTPDIIELLQHTDDIRLKDKELDIKKDELSLKEKEMKNKSIIEREKIRSQEKIAKMRPKPKKK